MKRVAKPMIIPLFAVAFSLGLVVLVASAPPTVAEPPTVTPQPAVEGPDGRAGACWSFTNVPDPSRPFIQMAFDAGSRWDRFDFTWSRLEPGDNDWSAEVDAAYDSLLNALRSGGIENMVGILMETPEWAATGGLRGMGVPSLQSRPPGWYLPSAYPSMGPMAVSAASSPPRGLYEEWDDWTASDGDPINYWGRFVHTVVSEYGDRVKYWEMWNEVDDQGDQFWSGSEADYAQLLKVGYQASKDACPDCTVLYAGLWYWADPQHFERVLDIVNNDPEAPANNYFFDVMSVHLYSRSSSIYDKVREIRTQMNRYVSDHPIWLTETGVQVWDDTKVFSNPTPYPYTATMDEAAAYVIQSYANAWAADVKRYFFFRTHDYNMPGFGLMRNDLTFRPAYVAYQVSTGYLISPTMATKQSYSQGARRVTLWGTPRGKVSVLWNAISQTLVLDYPAILPSATLVDRWGVTQTITPTAGVYALTLPGATNNLGEHDNDYIIGGETYLVIEADTVPPTGTIQPLPTTTYSYTVLVSWEGGDDAAGIWGFEVQVREGTEGAWTNWLGLDSTSGITAALYADGQHDETVCFRTRAWDRAGNHSEWPAGAQACTKLDMEREIHVNVGAVYGDADSDDVWDTGEITLTNVWLRLVDEMFVDIVTPTVGGSWEFTITVMGGDYSLLATPDGWWSFPPGWLPWKRAHTVLPEETGLELSYPELGLKPHKSTYIFPLAARYD